MRIHRPLLAALVVLGLVPAAASAALRIDTLPDPDAPAGVAPKVVFALSGLVKGQHYRVTADQVSGQNPLNEQGYPVICSPLVGRLVYEKAPTTRILLKPSPATYELKSNTICTGTYRGRVEQRRTGGRPPKVLATFTLGMPSMRLTHVSVKIR